MSLLNTPISPNFRIPNQQR